MLVMLRLFFSIYTPLYRKRLSNITVGAVAMTFGVAALLPASKAHSQSATRYENAIMSATVTSIETSPGGNGLRFLTANIHVHNSGKQPLTLGVEAAKVTANDDQHNSYGGATLRGIGTIAGSRVDPQFVLSPQSGADILIEMRWRADKGVIFGTTFDLTLPLRVIVPLTGGQYKLATEYLMTFTGLKAGLIEKPKDAASLPENTVNAGPFTMQITRLTPSEAGRWHVAILAARIQNTSDKPLALAYVSTSSFGIDDQGNRFAYGVGGTHDTSVSGIGMLTGANADPQFTLGPGESRDVQFRVIRARERDVSGKRLTYYVALAQLETLPGNQIRTVRQYSLAFPRIAGLN